MPFVNPTLPADGESADALDITGPFLELLAVFNGHIGPDNLEPGTIPDSIGTASVDADKLAANSVTTPKIAADAVTPEKVAPAAVVPSSTAGVLTPLLTSRMFIVSALAENATVAAPAGTPDDGQTLLIRIKDNGTGRTLAWNAIYRGINLTLPAATTGFQAVYVSCVYNAAATKWDVVSVVRG